MNISILTFLIIKSTYIFESPLNKVAQLTEQPLPSPLVAVPAGVLLVLALPSRPDGDDVLDLDVGAEHERQLVDRAAPVGGHELLQQAALGVGAGGLQGGRFRR